MIGDAGELCIIIVYNWRFIVWQCPYSLGAEQVGKKRIPQAGWMCSLLSPANALVSSTICLFILKHLYVRQIKQCLNIIHC